MFNDSFPSLIERTLAITEQMHACAARAEWVELEALNQQRTPLIVRLEQRLGERDQHAQAVTLLRQLHERNDSLRTICEQAREQLFAQIQTTNRSRAAMQAYTAA